MPTDRGCMGSPASRTSAERPAGLAHKPWPCSPVSACRRRSALCKPKRHPLPPLKPAAADVARRAGRGADGPGLLHLGPRTLGRRSRRMASGRGLAAAAQTEENKSSTAARGKGLACRQWAAPTPSPPWHLSPPRPLPAPHPFPGTQPGEPGARGLLRRAAVRLGLLGQPAAPPVRQPGRQAAHGRLDARVPRHRWAAWLGMGWGVGWGER